MTDLLRFPHTPHVAWLGPGQPRGDKVLSAQEVADLLSAEVVLEEKLDGANLGFSLSPDGALRAQNRGQYLQTPFHGQFARLAQWLPVHEEQLFDGLGAQLIAFGEWCAARHSLDYDTLPDWWLLFDVYDRSTGRFWNTRRRNAWAAENGFATVPVLGRGRWQLAQLVQLLQTTPSRYRTGPLEGVVIRKEDDEGLRQRAKLVRADFTQAMENHWRGRALQWNRLAV